jgi:cytochrome b pre-mRNA-processing protein 3
MFSRLFGRARRANREVVDAVYERIVASARQPVFYGHWAVPDTPLGRFEMLCAHMVLVLHRARGADPAMAELAQELTDEFFKDVDHSLRELGIGDMGVPKRMKKFARMFYGRLNAYAAALDAGNRDDLAVALSRNIHPEAFNGSQPVEGTMALARHMMAVDATLRVWPDEQLLAGQLPDIAPAGLVRS